MKIKKEDIKKELRTIVVMLLIIILIYILMLGIFEQSQYMNSLDYKVELLQDGSMKVTETWDIYISRTNTIFRDFTLSSSYGDIENVNVVDLKTGKSLKKINEEMYHVTTDCFYALETNSRTFEIAWGTGMENSFGRKKYQITYKISNVINSYKDCQEWYWKLLEKGENAIPVKKVTGTITLPKEVKNIENLKVWGHGQVSGNIKRASNNSVKFKIKNLKPKAMLELRVVSAENMFNVSRDKTKNYNKLNSIIKEETNWAEETNQASGIAKIFLGIVLIIYVVIIIVTILNIIKYTKIIKKENNGIKKSNIKYYRDIPREKDSTPNEANYLYNFNKTVLENKAVQSEMVSATILDLCLKKIISLNVNKEKVFIKILINKPNNLKPDEMEIFKLLQKAGKGKEEFEIEELNKYAKTQYYEYSKSINKLVNSARNSLYNLKLIDKKQEKEYSKSKGIAFNISFLLGAYKFFIVALITSYIPIFTMSTVNNFGISAQNGLITILLWLLPVVILMIWKWKLMMKVKNKIAVLTQEGADEKAQWKGLAKFMQDFSLLKEKEIPELAVWEKYLVYATAFGIADKVIEQMKANYPEVFIEEKWDDEKIMNEYPVIHFMTNPVYMTYTHFNPILSLNTSAKTAYDTSIREIAAHSSSSGSGSGGGFSGGGGRR